MTTTTFKNFRTLFLEDSDAVYNAAAKDHAAGGPRKRLNQKIKNGIKIDAKDSKYDLVVYQNVGHNRANLLINGESCQIDTKRKLINCDPSGKASSQGSGLGANAPKWYLMSDIFSIKEIKSILDAVKEV